MTHILLALFLTLWSLVGAQPGGRGNDRLERAGLKVGQDLPQANLYTADGRHFSLSELGGSYTVLIFGCLT
jgi:cytochrome oxidase Cu insertion factor (SCO1/SenC/PrrC family)